MFKKLFSLTALFAMIASTLAPLGTIVHAADSTATVPVAFEITAPTTAVAGQAIDVTVRAVDKDKNTVTSYQGSIIFVTDYIGDVVPMPGKSIAFTKDDNGVKTFSKGVIFKKTGKQTLYVSDVSQDIAGQTTVTVTAAPDAAITATGETVTIITPQDQSQITGNTVVVSGKTRKNSKVTIMLNSASVGTVTTDDSGIFTKNISGLTQATNVLSASLVDATNNVIATSPNVTFGLAGSGASVYGVTLSPSTSVAPSTPIMIAINATPGLSAVTATIDGSVLTAKEATAGQYTIQTPAPSNPGSYSIDVGLTTSLAQTTTQSGAATLTVTAASAPAAPAFKNVKTVTDGGKVTFSFEVDNAPADLDTFKIAYGDNADSLSQEKITYQASKIFSWGVYTWYIDQLPAKTYTFKIFGRKADGTLIDGLVSDPIIATIGQDGCTIGNVGPITVQTDTSKSILTWAAVPGATAYNLYRISAAGDYNLFQHVTDPTYTLFLSKGAVTYDNFAVKAICGKDTESKDYSGTTKVQTGPGAMAFVVIVSAVIAAIVMRRRAV